MADVEALEQQVRELKAENFRLRQVKDEAIEQAEQWKRAFCAEQEYAKKLERQMKGVAA